MQASMPDVMAYSTHPCDRKRVPEAIQPVFLKKYVIALITV